MPRPKLTPPEVFAFRNEYQVRVTDVNYGGHLANHALDGLLHQARTDILHQLGVSEFDLGDGGIGLIQTDTTLLFCAEAFLRDLLLIESAFLDIGRSRFRMFHRISRGVDLIALAELGFAGFDYRVAKPGRLPEAFRERLKTGGGNS